MTSPLKPRACAGKRGGGVTNVKKFIVALKKYVLRLGMAILYGSACLCSCSQHPSVPTEQAQELTPLTVEDFMQPVVVPLNPLKKPVDRTNGKYVPLPPRPVDNFIEEVIGERGKQTSPNTTETTDEDTSADESAATDDEAMTDESATTDDEAVTDESATTDDEAMTDESATTDDEAMTDESATTDDEAMTDESATTDDEAVTDESATTDDEAMTDESAATDEDTTAEESAATDEDTAADDEMATDEEDSTLRLYVYRAKYQSAASLKATLEAAYTASDPTPVFIAPDEAAAVLNSDLVIRATRRDYVQIKALLAKIDRQPMQVYLDVLIAEVVMSDHESLGAIIELFTKGQIAAGGANLPVESFSSTYFADVLGSSEQGLAYSIASPGVFGALVRALAQSNRIKVLSEPHIFVRNNSEATISVGQEVPVKTSTTEGTTVTEKIDNQKVELKLTVTPRVNHDGTLLLNLTETYDDVASEDYQGTGAPLVTTRNMTTAVVARDGLTVLMGGLITEKSSRDRRGVPLLQDLPLVGRIFRNDITINQKNELIVLLTPYIMWTPEHEAFYTNMMNQYVSPWKNDDQYLESGSVKIKRQLQRIQDKHQ